jgi:hypothetical protein
MQQPSSNEATNPILKIELSTVLVTMMIWLVMVERKVDKRAGQKERAGKIFKTGSKRRRLVHIHSDTVLMRIDVFGLGDDTDGSEAFTIDESTGTIRTKVTLDHEERAFYRLAVSVKDHGRPPKETVRQLQIEVLDLNDNRPTFSTSSFAFKVSHITRAGHDGFSLSSHAPFLFFFIIFSSSFFSHCLSISPLTISIPPLSLTLFRARLFSS